MDEEISYKGLRRIEELEKNAPGLSHLPGRFYSQVFLYIQGLREAGEEEENPQKQSLIHDELKKIQRIVITIYEQREKKIMQSALSAARGGKPDQGHFLEEEQVFLTQMIELLRDQRSQMLQQKQKEETKKKPVETSEQTPKEKPASSDQPIVRITQDIREFIGTDMKTYVLKKDDVLSLPPDMTDTLSKRKVAQLIR